MKGHLYFLVVLLLSACAAQENVDSTWWTSEDRQHIIDELNRTTEELQREIGALSEVQANFHESDERWSITQIIEHLEMQNQLHFREISVMSKAPQHLQYRKITKGQDDYFVKYASDAAPGEAQWFLESLDRYNSRKAAWDAFLRARTHLRDFVAETKVDLRKQFTFRAVMEGKGIDEVKIGEVRDLHQLLLTGIAHTDRHIQQIKKIKAHSDFPVND